MREKYTIHTDGLKLFCELRCCCWGVWAVGSVAFGVGGNGRLACGGSGTTIKRCGNAGRDGGPGSSIC